jgi:hypothetical protein
MEDTKAKKARPKGTLTFSGNVSNMGKIMKIAFYRDVEDHTSIPQRRGVRPLVAR